MESNPAVDDMETLDIEDEDDGDWQEWTADDDDENVTLGDDTQCLFCTEKVRYSVILIYLIYSLTLPDVQYYTVQFVMVLLFSSV